MSGARLIVVVGVVLVLRWLAAARVVVMVAGIPVSMPALLVVAVTVLVVAAAVVALLVYRSRAERAMVAAWRARYAAVPCEGSSGL